MEFKKRKNISNNSSFLQALGQTIFVLLMSCLGYVNLLIPGAEFFFWKPVVQSWSRHSPHFMKPKDSLPCSQNVHSNNVTASYADCLDNILLRQ